MLSGFWLVTRCEPRTRRQRLEDRVARDAALLRGCATPAERPPSAAIATNRCSVLTYSSLSRSASCSAASVTWRSRGDSATCEPPCARGSLSSSRAHRRRDRRRIGVHLADDRRDDAFLLFEEREQQVLRQDLGMSLAIGELLRAEDRFLCFLCVLVDVHDRLTLLPSAISCAPAWPAPRNAPAVPSSARAAAGRRPWRRDRRASSGLPTTGMPCPFSRNTWPFCVVSGNLQPDASR